MSVTAHWNRFWMTTSKSLPDNSSICHLRVGIYWSPFFSSHLRFSCSRNEWFFLIESRHLSLLLQNDRCMLSSLSTFIFLPSPAFPSVTQTQVELEKRKEKLACRRSKLFALCIAFKFSRKKRLDIKVPFWVTDGSKAAIPRPCLPFIVC